MTISEAMAKRHPDDAEIRRVKYHRCFSLNHQAVVSSHSALHLSQIFDAKTISDRQISSVEIEQLEWLLQMVFDQETQKWRQPTEAERPVGGYAAPPGAHIQIDDCIVFRGME